MLIIATTQFGIFTFSSYRERDEFEGGMWEVNRAATFHYVYLHRADE